MARRSFGNTHMVNIPANLRDFFTVSQVAATTHRGSRAKHPLKPHKPHRIGMHGARRAPDPWHHKAAPSGR